MVSSFAYLYGVNTYRLLTDHQQIWMRLMWMEMRSQWCQRMDGVQPLIISDQASVAIEVMHMYYNDVSYTLSQIKPEVLRYILLRGHYSIGPHISKRIREWVLTPPRLYLSDVISHLAHKQGIGPDIARKIASFLPGNFLPPNRSVQL